MLGKDFKGYTENEKSSGLCPTQKLNSGSAEPGRVVGETATYVVGRCRQCKLESILRGTFVSVYLF